MTEILDFVKNASPIMLVALCLIIILMMLMQNTSLFDIFKRQKLNTFKIEGGKTILDTIAKQLDLIATNHLHELPDLVETVKRIEQEQILQGNRLTSVETAIKYIAKND